MQRVSLAVSLAIACCGCGSTGGDGDATDAAPPGEGADAAPPDANDAACPERGPASWPWPCLPEYGCVGSGLATAFPGPCGEDVAWSESDGSSGAVGTTPRAFDYDRAGLLTDYADVAHWTHDSAGRRATCTGRCNALFGGPVTFEYDERGRLVREEHEGDEVHPGPYVIAYSYDGCARVAGIGTPVPIAGRPYRAAVAFDAEGRPTKLTWLREGETVDSAAFWRVRLAYDDAGRLIEVDDDGEPTTYTYDDLGNLVSRAFDTPDEARDSTCSYSCWP
jgi:YD repeat-containing protein